MKTNLVKLIAFVLFISFNLKAQTTFTAEQSDNRNQATFTSDAPLEKIVGVASGIDAQVTLDKNDITKNPQGIVKIAVENIKTGIDLRDEHLRSEMWMNAGEYPFIEFQLTDIKDATANSLNNGNEIKATAVGDFSLHGVTNRINVPVELTYLQSSEKTKARLEGNLLRVNGEFDIKLSDYNIKIPDMVVGKVDDTVKLTFDFVASDAKVNQ